MTDEEHSIYKQYYDVQHARLDDLLHVDLVVYLRTDPVECLKRLMKRCQVTRPEEAGVPLVCDATLP